MQPLPDLDLDLVRCFLAVAESGGFTSASRRLNLSQSAVSLKIQRLEGLLERSVFTRSSRSLKLTAEGEVVLGYGRRLLALNQEMFDRLLGATEPGTVHLGVMPQFGMFSLPDLLSKFKRSHPNIRLCVEVGMTDLLLARLEADKLDLVIGGAGRTTGGSLMEEGLLLHEKVVWTRAAHSVLDPYHGTLPLVLFPEPCGYRRAALELLEAAGRSWEVVYTSASLESVQAAVLADLGFGVMDKRSMLPGMKVVTAKGSKGLPALPDIGISIYRRKSPANARVHALSAFVARAVDQATP